MRTFLALLLALLPIAVSHAADNNTPAGNHDQAPPPSPAKVLSDLVNDIAHSQTLTFKEKDDQIAAAVHNAVVAATANLTDPADIFKATLELTTAAASAAPQFTKEIIDAISNIQAIADINGALRQIQTAVIDAAAKAAGAAFDSNQGYQNNDNNRHHDDDFIVSPSH